MLTPGQYVRVTQVALAALTLIVVTGAAVRLTGSGLGCPDWPRCYGRALPPLDTNALIEFGNRVVSGVVGVVAVLASALAWGRRPFRRDLAVLGLLLPLGVIGQAVLGGFTVREHLKPGFVMAHFALSMLVLAAAVALCWRAAREPSARPGRAGRDRFEVWAARALLGLGAVVIFAGTAATAAGPHAGGKRGQTIQRLTFDGSGTLDWTIHRHGELAAALGVLAVGLLWGVRRRGAHPRMVRALTILCGLLAAQGLVGIVQYETQLPAGLVWVHVTLATLAWLTILWVVATAGQGAPARARAPAGLGPADPRPTPAPGSDRLRLPA